MFPHKWVFYFKVVMAANNRFIQGKNIGVIATEKILVLLQRKRIESLRRKKNLYANAVHIVFDWLKPIPKYLSIY